MTQSPSSQQAILRPEASPTLPALFTPDAAAARRFVEFFTANIRNPNTRKAYARAVGEFDAWCDQHALREFRGIQPVHVAAYIEGLQQRLAAIRMLFDWLAGGGPGGAPQSGECGSWASLQRQERHNAGADRRRNPRPARLA